MTIRYLPHAEEAMQRRGIERAWIEETLAFPDWTDVDPRSPDRVRSFKLIEAMENRVLRVVHWTEGPDTVVLTVHPDRNALKRVQRS